MHTDAAPHTDAARQLALDVLCSRAYIDAVDLAAWPDTNGINVANAHGRALLTPEHPLGTHITGTNPINAQRHPDAYRRLASYFTDDRAAHLIVSRGPRARGTNIGEHGALDRTSSTAPLLISGPGARPDATHANQARMIDIAPTILTLLGIDPTPLGDIDGRPLTDHITPGVSERVLVVLWDGCAPDTIRAATDHNIELPGLARLQQRNHLWATNGLLAEFPSLTVVNHTSALTGVGPGRHGMVANNIRDPHTGTAVDAANPATFHRIAELYRDNITTSFTVAQAAGKRTASINEITALGSELSTFADVAAASPVPTNPDFFSRPADEAKTDADAAMLYIASQLPPADDPTIHPDMTASDFLRMVSQVDAWGYHQMRELFNTDNPPDLTWWSSYATDVAHHETGPATPLAIQALTDVDARLHQLITLLESHNAFDTTTIIVIADHGSLMTEPDPDLDWEPALTEHLSAHGYTYDMPGDNQLWFQDSSTAGPNGNR